MSVSSGHTGPTGPRTAQPIPMGATSTVSTVGQSHHDPAKVPLRKLAADLNKTLEHDDGVRGHYALKRKRSQPPAERSCGTGHSERRLCNDGYDDEDFHYIIKPGERWFDRYDLNRLIGKGTFGQVAKAFDRSENEYVAIKIIQSTKTSYCKGVVELKFLELLAMFDTESRYTVQLKCCFLFRRHLCLVLELLSYNLHYLLIRTNFQGVSLRLTGHFAKQLGAALLFLSAPPLQLIHCDLKPANIVLCRRDGRAIKIVDFGSATRVGDPQYPQYMYIQTRYYRAPEVLLGLTFDTAIDMWSIACTLVEVHIGRPLFFGVDEIDQMYRIIEVLGMPPDFMLEQGTKTCKYFEKASDGSYFPNLELFSRGDYYPPGGRSLREILGADSGGPGGRRHGQQGHSPADYAKFVDLISQMLEYDPKKRIKPYLALRHEFFQSQRMNIAG